MKMQAIQMGIILSRLWNANCLFNTADYDYFKYRIGLQDRELAVRRGHMESFDLVLRNHLPNLSLIPHYAYGDECRSCIHEKKCSKDYLKNLEKNTLEMIRWRDYDEIQQLSEVIRKLVSKVGSSKDIDPKEIYNDLRMKEVKINKLIKKVFPKISRWSSLTTCISIPFAIGGLAVNNPLLTVTGATFAGGSKIVSETLKYIESKNRWIGFMNENQNRP